MTDGAHIPCARCLALQQHLARKKKGSTFAGFVVQETALLSRGAAAAVEARGHALTLARVTLSTLLALLTIEEDPSLRARLEQLAEDVRSTLAVVQQTRGCG